MVPDPEPAETLPLTPLSLAILVALGEGPLHGYGVIKAIEEETAGRIRPAAGSLYAALDRMEEEGLLEESEAPREADDARRRYYRLTAFGRAVARAEIRRLTDVVELAGRRRLGPEAEG